MSATETDQPNLNGSGSDEDLSTALRKKFVYYGLAWLVGLFVCFDLFDAFFFFLVTRPNGLPRAEPLLPFAIVVWPLYWYAMLAWRLWLRISKKPLPVDEYKWGLIGTWVLISISAFGFFHVQYDRGFGLGAVGLMLFGFLPAMLFACIGSIVGILVYQWTRKLAKISDLHRFLMIATFFGGVGIALSQVSGEAPTWWQLAISGLVGVGFFTIMIAVIARTLKRRAEFGFGDDNGEPRGPPSSHRQDEGSGCS